ncbi:MAG: 4Fe-4S dicluster domain-containing protein [Anaerolineales bacterium]|nr:4Fe-4S dicluster domain-containing protein [Anaerolineales bacterium]
MIAIIFLLICGFLVAGGFGAFAWLSLQEGEPRAMKVALGIALIGGGIFFVAAASPDFARRAFVGVVLFSGAILVILFFIPMGIRQVGMDTPSRRVDEREIMFARARLQPGTSAYTAYYQVYPEHQKGDDRTRALPGLLSSHAKYFDPLHNASPDGSFFLTHALREAVNGPVSTERVEHPPQQLTAYIKGLARYFGALDVGITPLRPYHVYSHIGRGTGEYGAPIPVEHTYAIAFTVEMDFDMVAAAPRAPIVMESGRQYVEAARTAVQLAQAIRTMGYAARAHIDGNYRVIAPLVARDAGLGEIGRMSLLMTPKQGPRVRLGVVTTNLELIPDTREPNVAMIDFCSICKKCAVNCPSRSIPVGDRQQDDGVLRWKIDPDTCFRYWNVIGTDCGRCMAVCPYSHPDNWAHNLVRRGIQRSGAFRRAALWLDDVFYGKQPDAKPLPAWLE